MKQFNFINSFKQLENIFIKNGDTISYRIDRSDFEEIKNGETIVVGNCNGTKLYGKVWQKSCQPREKFQTTNAILEYYIIVKLLIEVNIKLLTPTE